MKLDQQSQNSSPINDLEEKNIVIVDDEDMILRLFITLLKNNPSINVLTTSQTGEKALKIIEESKVKIHLVITDLKLHDMSGTEILEKIKKIRADLPVILMSGSSTFDKKKALQKGFADFIPKPFKTQKILEILEEAIQ